MNPLPHDKSKYRYYLRTLDTDEKISMLLSPSQYN